MTINMKIIGLLYFFTFAASVPKPYLDPSALYQDTETGVIELNSGNIVEELKRSSKSTIINFYAAWCGHCIDFASVYKRFQFKVQHWNIVVAAINCAYEKNTDICRDAFKIEQYPTIKLFRCASQNLTGVDMDNFGKAKNIKGLIGVTASFLMNNSDCAQSTQSSRNFNSTAWDKFKLGYSLYEYYVISIAEAKDFSVVDSLSLDLELCNRIFVTMIDIRNVDQISKFGNFRSPAVIAVDQNLNIKLLSNKPESYSQLRLQLFNFFGKKCQALELLKMVSTNDQQSHSQVLNSSTIHENSDVVLYMEDLIKGIGLTFRHEITRKQLTVETSQIVHQWVNTLRECMYFNKKQTEFLESVTEWLNSQSSPLDVVNWIQLMRSDKAQEAFPTNLQWRTCKGSKHTFRGFPCSLWILFHAMTLKCEKPSRILHLTSKDVLLSVRAYITNFFGCYTCRQHFKELTRSVGTSVQDSQQAILFLWNGHNYVNARLRLEDSADPLAPKIQFPSELMCPECRRVENLTDSQVFTSKPGYGINPISWNKLAVLNFIRNFYGPDNIKLSFNESISSELAPDGDLYDPAIEFVSSLQTKLK